MITLKDINKTYDMGQASLHVLKGINLQIEKGEYVSIMGASGSGKSTLLNILGILDNYDTGEYYLNGTLIKDLSEKQAAVYRNEMIGFVFQSFNLINFKNALENVALPLYYKNVSRKKREGHPEHDLPRPIRPRQRGRNRVHQFTKHRQLQQQARQRHEHHQCADQ